MSFPQGASKNSRGRINVRQSLARADALKTPIIRSTRPAVSGEAEAPRDTGDGKGKTFELPAGCENTATSQQGAHATISRECAHGIYVRVLQGEGGEASASASEPKKRSTASEHPLSTTFDELLALQTQEALRAREPDEKIMRLASEYVRIFDPSWSTLNEKEFHAKVIEVAKFYSAPVRIGRLESLIAEFHAGASNQHC
jgi:hypothetical protein